MYARAASCLLDANTVQSLTTPSELRVALEALNVIGDYEALFKAHVVPVLAELLWEQSTPFTSLIARYIFVVIILLSLLVIVITY